MAYYRALPDRREHAIARRQIVWCVASLIALSGAIFLYQLGGLALFEPDEGRNAEIAREILLLKDWVTPHYDFVPYLDKPMLFYWLAAMAYKVCGVSEMAARLPSMLAAVGCVLLVFDLGRRRGGIAGGLASSLILATSPLFVAFAHTAIFDMTLTFFVTLGLWAFSRAADDGGRHRTRWALVMGAAVALATLTKGPIGVVLPALVVLVWAVWSKRWWFLGGSAPAVGVGIFVLLVVPWYLVAEQRNPGYLRYFLLEENLLRYLTTRFRKEGPWHFYLVVLALGMFPWSPWLYPLLRGIRTVLKDEHTRLMCIWAAVPLVFFSLSSSKLPGYVLPCLPPMALLLGGTVPPLFESGAKATRWLHRSAGAVYSGYRLVRAAGRIPPSRRAMDVVVGFDGRARRDPPAAVGAARVVAGAAMPGRTGQPAGKARNVFRGGVRGVRNRLWLDARGRASGLGAEIGAAIGRPDESAAAA